jgi:hypothetical protein
MRQGTHTRLPFSMVLMPLVGLLFGNALDAGGMSVLASGRNVQNPRSLMCDRSIRIGSRLHCRMHARAPRVLSRPRL